MTNIYFTLAHISDGSPTQRWPWNEHEKSREILSFTYQSLYIF